MTRPSARRRALAAALVLFIAPAIRAHTAHKPRHGGIVRHGGDLNYELVVGPGTVDVWVTDEADKPVATEGSTAMVTFIDPGSRLPVPLAPAGGNRLAGKGAIRTKAGQQALLEVAVGGKTIGKVTYTLK